MEDWRTEFAVSTGVLYVDKAFRQPVAYFSVGTDLKELGGQLPKCLKFCPGIEVYGRFSLKNERM